MGVGIYRDSKIEANFVHQRVEYFGVVDQNFVAIVVGSECVVVVVVEKGFDG